MTEIPSEADINCPAEEIFDVITDLRGQDRWLTASSAFRGTEDISAGPVRLGTTYREPGPFGVRNGTVTEFVPPTMVTFHQPMTMKLRAGTVDVVMRYTLIPGPRTTLVRRVVTVGIPWPLRLVRPVLVHAFAVESRRTLLALKAYADRLRRP